MYNLELSWPDWVSGHPTQVTYDTVSQGTDTHHPQDMFIKTAQTFIMQKNVRIKCGSDIEKSQNWKCEIVCVTFIIIWYIFKFLLFIKFIYMISYLIRV